jgi:hypothetical protein
MAYGEHMSGKKRSLPTQPQSATLCAMQANADSHGLCKMGLLTQITPNFPIEVCGEGFNEKTVRVRVKGQFYFVFREDLRVDI